MESGLFAVVPSLGLCAYAHELQGNKLAQSLGLENELWKCILAVPALSKFCFISTPTFVEFVLGFIEAKQHMVSNHPSQKHSLLLGKTIVSRLKCKRQ